jgi:hypothetical protein
MPAQAWVTGSEPMREIARSTGGSAVMISKRTPFDVEDYRLGE